MRIGQAAEKSVLFLLQTLSLTAVVNDLIIQGLR